MSSPQSTPKLRLTRVAACAAAFTATQLVYERVSSVPLSAQSVFLAAVGGLLSAWLVAVMVGSMQVDLRGRFLLLWLSFFIVQLFANLIEGVFFTTEITSVSLFLRGTLVAAAVALAESSVAVLVLPSSSPSMSLRASMMAHLSARPRSSWSVRLLAGALAYFPVYFLFGALVSPIVIPYYTDLSLGLGLTIPSFSSMILVELLRGGLFVLALFPLIAAVRLSRRNTFLSIALFLYVFGAYLPLVEGTATLPWVLRFVHSAEILADSLVYGAILTYLAKPD